MPRYVVALAFEYFRNLIDDEGDVYMTNIPYKKSTILEVIIIFKAKQKSSKI